MSSSSTSVVVNSHRAGFLQEVAPLLRLRWLQLAVLAGLLVVVGVAAFQIKLFVLDLDIWWHLKVGDWIVQHAAFPHSGILSRSAADRPWIAYSWGFEVLLSRFYAWFGLIGIGLYGTLLTLAVAFSVYWMARRLSGRFWMSCVLAAITCYSFLFLMMPRPVFFSIILLCVSLTLIFEAQRHGRVQTLYWLPLIFFLWANLHIQFIYGLAVLGLFVAINTAQRFASRLGIALNISGKPDAPASSADRGIRRLCAGAVDQPIFLSPLWRDLCVFPLYAHLLDHQRAPASKLPRI